MHTPFSFSSLTSLLSKPLFSLVSFFCPKPSPYFLLFSTAVMSQSRHSLYLANYSDMTEMILRLKTRLALADFKRQHGYERYDLSTLESNLFKRSHHHKSRRSRQQQQQQQQQQQSRHRYYPTSPVAASPCKTIHSTYMLQPATLLRSPLSEKRHTPPRARQITLSPSSPSTATLSSDDEDAANLLVMLHNRV
ncbi:hypothetical protein BX666DRAFT_1898882 [Dichotomocladium elegans]|nr:hypothetical protein BX666DRAFT_1898882 [Dichotomocladium elegans]